MKYIKFKENLLISDSLLYFLGVKPILENHFIIFFKLYLEPRKSTIENREQKGNKREFDEKNYV